MVVPSTSKKEQTLILIAEKVRIENKITEYGHILEANDNVGMLGSLIDLEGFPRNDIDVYQVRHARNQIICLQNDLKALLKEIENGIHDVHAEAAETIQAGLSTKTAGLNLNSNDERPKIVIVRINLVSPGSPAEDAGLKVDDEIIEFGSINYTNFQNNLLQIGEIVKHKQKILLKVKRNEQLIDLNLTPRTWSGRGLLGCNIVLPDKVER